MRDSISYRVVKRSFDVIVAVFILVLTSPIFFLITLLLKLTGEGHVFYLQERVGYKNKIFNIWKFATMLKNSPSMGTGDVTIKNDPRLLPMGKFLRKTKLNELPQLINILKGDMTLIGPRPLMPIGFQRYSPEVQSSIYDVYPGLTGIGSVIFRDEESIISRSKDYEATYQKINNWKGQIEIWYQKNMSFITDTKIFFLTFWALFFPHTELPYVFFKTLPRLNKEVLLER